MQNQAYGYLFPMGPFFAAGVGAGLPPWVVQRLWLALLMSTAFLGVVALARRLQLGSPASQLVAGVLYALSPRMLTALGATSVEVLPMAVAPWVLVPLVGAAALRSPRRAAALSGLAVLCAGGVNAVAVAAVLPLPVLWLLTRPAGAARRRLAAWWAAAVLLATAWWAVPLLLLGRYSPPFLDHIESAAVTTLPTDVLSVLRGTSHWVAGLFAPTGPQWPTGWALVHETLPVAGTLVLATAGALALVRRDLPERTWLVLGVLAGTALVTLGHVAPVDGLLADALRTALDEQLAPLRNVHKFDPVLRLPLVLGLAHLLPLLVSWARRTRLGRDGGPAVVAVLVVAFLATASPAVAGRLAPLTGIDHVPDWWYRTADFLADASPSGRALLVPGSSFGTYAWGGPNDEPLQPLARSPWEVRNAVPLTPTAHVRFLDAVEQRLARGEGSAGLARTLARAGISHVVLRNDLDTGAARATRPALVRQALAGSPGLRRVAAFGELFPGEDPVPGLVFDAGLNRPSPAIEIWSVADPAPRAWTAPLDGAVVVAGGPDAVLQLEDRDLLRGRPTVLAGEPVEGTGPAMAGDALLRRERTFGRTTAAASAGLSPEDPLRLDAPARDYPVPHQASAESVVRYDGGTPSASSSASDPVSFFGTSPDASPWAALDGDPATSWEPAPSFDRTGGTWWRLETDDAFAGRAVTLVVPDGPGGRPERVRLTTDAGSHVVPLRDTDGPQRLPLPVGRTRTLTVAADGPGAGVLRLAEVRLRGVEVTRTVVLPPADGPVDVLAFDAANPPTSGCLVDGRGPARCAGGLVSGGEETVLDRTFDAGAPGRYELAVTAVPRPGPALDALVAGAAGMRAGLAASSTAVPDPRAGAFAAVDGDPGTAWLADAGDRRPSLTLTWARPRTIDRLRVVPPSGAAEVPTAVTLDDGGLPRTVALADDGSAQFAPLTTDRLTVSVARATALRSFDGYTRQVTDLPVGIAELEFGRVRAPAAPGTPVELPCGQGPEVTVDGEVRETSARTTLAALRRLDPVELTLCDGGSSVRLGAGEHRLTVAPTDVLRVGSATLERGAPAPALERGDVAVRTWDAERRTVEVGEREEATLLVVPENTNPGWAATLDGDRLQTVAVDGWQQGYVLPAGDAGTVRLEFTPGPAYRAGLLGGLAGVLLLLVLAVRRPRRRPVPPAARSRWTRALVPAAGAVVGVALVGGAVGLAALAAAVALAAVAGRRASAVMGGVVGLSLAAAGGLLLVDRASTATAQQVLAVVAVAALAACVVPKRSG